MIRIDARPEEKTADMTLPHACGACGGDLVVRVSPGNSRGYCAHCRSLSRPQVSLRNGVLQVAQPLVGRA